MNNSGKRMGEMLRDKLQEHERNTRCGRSDLELADYNRVGDHDYTILVEYARERGAPALSRLDEWVTATFNGAFRLNQPTVRNHPEMSAIRALIKENSIPLPMKRAASMAKLGGGRFLDKHQNQWEVREVNGENILVRSTDVHAEDILEERINRQRSGRYARLNLSMVRTAGTADLEVGDTVVYGEPGGGQLQKTGKISAVSAKSVKIQGREGDLDRSYVVDIVQKNPSAKAAQEKFLIDFMAEYLFAGDKAMAKKAVK